MNINLTKPNIGEKEIKAAKDVLSSGWLIKGMQVRKFEEELASFMGAKYAVATIGCTMALYLALRRFNLKKEDEVIVPSFTWSATASVVIQAGGTPVFADIRKDTWCLDPEDVKLKITKHTKIVIPVHYAARKAWGFENFPIPVLYDSAHRIGRDLFDGTDSAHSFYAVKNMTTVRGGAILTNDEEKAKYYRMLCSSGVNKDTLSRYQGGNQLDVSSFYYEVEVPAWNFDMTDVEAAIGRVQLTKVEALNKKREKIIAKYNAAFGHKNTGNHLYPILVKNRDEFLINMKKAGIQCAIHYLPLHLMNGYKHLNTPSLPSTEFVGKHCVSIPLHAELTDEEISYIVKKVKMYAEFAQ